MAEAPVDHVANTQVTLFSVSIDGADVGYVDNPGVDIGLELKDITLQAFFKQVLGQRVLGVNVKVKADLREITFANLARAFPWFAGNASATIAPPVLGGDLYQYAKAVILHPVGVTGTAMDYSFPKAVVTGGQKREGDNDKDDIIPIELTPYPDRSKFPNVVLGYIGPIPA